MKFQRFRRVPALSSVTCKSWWLAVAMAASTLVSDVARAEERELPRARLGMEGGLGIGRAGPTWAGGTGLGLSGGAQLTRWLGVEALVFGETGVVFFGRGHLAGLVAFGFDRLTVAVGGGVGALYTLHYGVPASTASFGIGVLRVEVAFNPTADGSHFAIGAEGVLGSTFAGNVTEYEGNQFARAYPLETGTPTGGVRLYAGLRY